MLAEGPFPTNDPGIVEQLEAAISRAPALAGTDIRVESHDGVVTLTGFARTMEDIAAAARLAWRVPGVRDVNNDIRVTVRPSRA